MTTGERRSSAQPSTAPHLISILSLIAGIIGLALSWTGWGLLLPIAAVVLGAIGRRREKNAKRYWLSGILLGIVGIIVSGISLFYQYIAIMAITGLTAG